MNTIALQCSYLERRAEACSRESEKWLKAEFMKTKIDCTYDGVIVDIRSFGVFVQLSSPFVDGMIPISQLGVRILSNIKKTVERSMDHPLERPTRSECQYEFGYAKPMLNLDLLILS